MVWIYRSLVNCHLLTAATILGAAAPSTAQDWVRFQDETTQRLQMTSVPASDGDESDLAIGDFDLDGDEDILVLRKLTGSVVGPRSDVFLRNESGVLIDRTAALCPDFMVPSDTRDVATIDYDNDGWIDFVTAETFGGQPRLFRNLGEDNAGVWQGFALATNGLPMPIVGVPHFCGVSTGDIDNDGWSDIYFSDYGQTFHQTVFPGTVSYDRLLTNNGNGTFADVTAARIPGGGNQFVFGTASRIADMNGDGWNDIVAAGGLFDPHRLLINDGTGSFPTLQNVTVGAAYQLNVADFDNDDDLDIYVCDDGQDYVIYNDGTNPDGTLQIHSTPVTGALTVGFNHNTRVADIDRDGFVDIGAADMDVDVPVCSGQFSALRNRAGQGLEGFEDPILPAGSQAWNVRGTFDVVYLDLNMDGWLDMFQGTCTEGYKVWIQDPFLVVPGTAFCFGDGGVSPGCTSCPCGNDASPGAGSGCLNATGQGATLSGIGTPSLASDTLQFRLTSANPSTFAVLASANHQLPSAGPCPPGAGIQSVALDGLRCIGGGLLRHGTRPTAADGSVGTSTNPWGPPAGPPGGILAHGGFVANQTRSFQVFYREEVTAVCGSGLNTSNGYAVTMQP